MKLLSIFVLLALNSLCQQSANPPAYGVTKVTSLTATAEVITIQGNQTAHTPLSKFIVFKGFDATCSVACTITLERDGTQATTTALTINQLNVENLPSTAQAFSSSNVGVGTVVAQYSLTAGGQIAINLTGKQLYSGFENLTIRTSAITGTTTINCQWTENY